MKEEREERIGLKESGDLPLDAPDIVPEKQLFKGKEFSLATNGPHYHLLPLCLEHTCRKTFVCGVFVLE